MSKIIMEEEVELTEREQEIYDQGHDDGFMQACTYVAAGLIVGVLISLAVVGIVRH